MKNLTSVDFRTVDVPCRIFSLMVTIKIKAAMGIIIQRFSFFFFFLKNSMKTQTNMKLLPPKCNCPFPKDGKGEKDAINV